MPLETVRAFADHGEVRGATMTAGRGRSQRADDDLAAAGLDYDDVVATLEQEGVEKFADSFADLLAGLRARAGAVAAS